MAYFLLFIFSTRIIKKILYFFAISYTFCAKFEKTPSLMSIDPVTFKFANFSIYHKKAIYPTLEDSRWVNCTWVSYSLNPLAAGHAGGQAQQATRKKRSNEALTARTQLPSWCSPRESLKEPLRLRVARSLALAPLSAAFPPADLKIGRATL